MNNNRYDTAKDARDWKDKYLSELENQERRQRLYQQQTELLVRAVTRISLLADGIDQQLDKQLAGIRQMLREGAPASSDLNTLVDALEGQVKRLDVVKSERAKVLAVAFSSLLSQLKSLDADKETKQQLKRFGKSLKQRSAQICEYSALVHEFAGLQQQILQELGRHEPKKPFWQGLFAPKGEKASTSSLGAGDDGEQLLSQPADNAQPKSQPIVEHEDDEYGARGEPLHLAEGPASTQQDSTISVQRDEQEPPFKRLSAAICGILSELLAQIEPPATAKENYRSAKRQLEAGLNWYELVPTLEDISIVVVCAFDRYQQEFEQFLVQLNQRLGEASQFISESEKVHSSRVEVDKQMQATVRAHVSSMQQSVDNATDLEQLKSEVNGKLDTILSTMDQSQAENQQQESALSDQLHALIERVKAMEKDSANAEQRIEEQRQRALRDVLTQLPNREAYQSRLEQEYERWRRYQRPLSLIVCDIDHFKQVNDTYGHLAGDKVLRIIAKSLAKRLRKTDFIARYGGEEFVILMPETDQQQALKVVEGVRSAIASCPFHFKEQPVSITLSFGITEFVDKDTPGSAFARADESLYQAKQRGRNCSVLAEQNGASQ